METLANYAEQQAAFADLARDSCGQRILLLRGDSGSGKSTLLKKCHKQAPDSLHKLFVDFKPGSVNVADIFSRTEFHLGKDKLPRFRQRLFSLNPSPAQIENNEIEGSGNLLSIILNTGSPEERDDRRVMLTDAWLEDVRALDKALLLSLDTYEKTSTEVRAWLHGVLARLPYTHTLRLAVAGRKVPDSDTGEEWADCCAVHKLCGVREAKHWLPVVTALGYSFPPEVPDPLSYLAGICGVCNGHPAQILNFIQSDFPKLQ